MKLSDALKSIWPTRGTSTILAALEEDNLALAAGKAETVKSLTEARERLEIAQLGQKNSTSDWAYWAYEGDIAFWRAVCLLFEAAEIVGKDSLPDVPYVQRNLTVMEACVAQVRWAESVLAAAKSSPSAC